MRNTEASERLTAPSTHRATARFIYKPGGGGSIRVLIVTVTPPTTTCRSGAIDDDIAPRLPVGDPRVVPPSSVHVETTSAASNSRRSISALAHSGPPPCVNTKSHCVAMHTAYQPRRRQSFRLKHGMALTSHLPEENSVKLPAI